nr:mucin-12-like [Procambarus clarkii]
MGLPRASGKRRWSGEDSADAVPAAKVMCTSPPHALCAEDVLHHPALTHAHASTPAHECELTTPAAVTDADETSTSLTEEEDHIASSSSTCDHHSQEDHSFTESEDDESMDERDDFIDDEEDKDSGFIDSNSIDNSSDDEVEGRVIPSDSSASSSTLTDASTVASTSLQLSLSQVLPPPSSEFLISTICPENKVNTICTASPSPVTIITPSPVSPVTILSSTPSSPVTITSPTLLPAVTFHTSTSSSHTITDSSPSLSTTIHASDATSLITIHAASPSSPVPFSPISTSPTSTMFLLTAVSTMTTSTTTTTTTVTTSEERLPGTLVNDASVTTVTATQTGTVVTSAYQGALSSSTYDSHSYPYPTETYPSRPSTPAAWESCNYYDGSQPNTNKYMEISPSKSSTSQSIQCDENGKSYLELGSASPYTHTYSSDCGNYTTSPSNYPSQSYNQTYTSPSSYGQPNTYYNSRQSYSPNPYAYPSSENYANFEGENGCSYGYGANTNTYGNARSTLPPSRGPPRCMSPYCDPTRGTARPSCYHQQRLSVLNVSMYKLNRFRQFPDPSLHRSVLICNTLRHIERELEAEGVSVATILAHSHAHAAHSHLQGSTPNPGTPPCPEPMPSSPPPSPAPSEGPLPSMHAPLVGSPLAAPVSLPPSTPVTPSPVNHYSTAVPTVQYPTAQYLPAEHSPAYDGRETVHMRPYSSLPSNNHHSEVGEGPSGVVDSEAEPEDTPPPSTPRPPPLPPEERTDAINWCSVLSLSSQTDLDSMNNNEYGDWSGEGSSELDYNRPDDAPPWKLPSLSADDVLKSFPEASKRLEANEDLDSIINVLVGS